ncbi:hypothetical protein PoB_006587600 [Plakobranchus ocellatus]|uniref:Uncharacterized protein n=1 Tax=Plakobranchus ocellatus TaxID=259542 RepID=A0AAV4D5D4_9GAST|nr:hypothetical protein PoB_006587600 [Plakobranchus ocellatus]
MPYFMFQRGQSAFNITPLPNGAVVSSGVSHPLILCELDITKREKSLLMILVITLPALVLVLICTMIYHVSVRHRVAKNFNQILGKVAEYLKGSFHVRPQNTVAINFVADCCTLNFFVTGEDGCFHVIESRFVSGVLGCNQVSSPVMRCSISLFLARWSPPGPTSTILSPSC